MKKYFFLAIVGCVGLYGDGPEKIEALSSKVVIEDSAGYFVLSDRSCFKVVAFVKRWRNLTEWWNNTELVSKNYDCSPSNWYLGSQIEVYSKQNNLEVDEANASNQEDLKQCTHLLVNSATGQVLFAISLEPADCIIRLFEDAHKQGYAEGFLKGSKKSLVLREEGYNAGYKEAYHVGYKEGYNTGYKDAKGD